MEHATAMPLAVLGYGDENGEQAALHDVLERTDIRGATVTVDALHTNVKTAKVITERHGANYVMSVKGNASETFKTLNEIDWEKHRDGHYAEPRVKAHGRWDRRSIEVRTTLGNAFTFPGVRQIARIRRERQLCGRGGKKKKQSDEFAYAITSLAREDASPKDLLALVRGHWTVENRNHRVRDKSLGEDACLTCTGNGPANRALCNNLVLAVIFSHRRDGETVTEARNRFQYDRHNAVRAICSPGRPPPT